MIPVVVLAAVFPPPVPLLVRTFDLGYRVEAFAVSPDGRHFAAVRDGNQIDVYDAHSGKLRHGVRFNDGDRVRALAFSPDGRTLAAGAETNTELRTWSVESGQQVLTVGDHAGGICAVAFGPDGKTLAMAARDGTIRLIDVSAGTVRATFGQREAEHVSGMAVAFEPTGRVLIVAGGLRQDVGRLHALTGGQPARKLAAENTGPEVPVLAVSPDGRTLLAARPDRGYDMWETLTARRRWTTRPETVGSAAFSPDGRFVAVAFETRVEVRGVREGDSRVDLFEVPAFVASGGGMLFTAGLVVRVWLWPSPRLLHTRSALSATYSSVELATMLEHKEPEVADSAIGALGRRPTDAVRQADRALKAVLQSDREAGARVRVLVADLGHDDFRVREAASARLLRMANEAPADVLRAAREVTNPEAASRLAEVVRQAKLTGLIATPTVVRWLELLELVNTPDARATVKALAEHSPDAELTRDAIETLKRMQRRAISASPSTP